MPVRHANAQLQPVLKNVRDADNIRHENEAKGSKKAKIEFDVPADFALEDCRKCPLSYIGRNGDENVYECPLQMRGSCRLELS